MPCCCCPGSVADSLLLLAFAAGAPTMARCCCCPPAGTARLPCCCCPWRDAAWLKVILIRPRPARTRPQPRAADYPVPGRPRETAVTFPRRTPESDHDPCLAQIKNSRPFPDQRGQAALDHGLTAHHARQVATMSPVPR